MHGFAFLLVANQGGICGRSLFLESSDVSGKNHIGKIEQNLRIDGRRVLIVLYCVCIVPGIGLSAGVQFTNSVKVDLRFHAVGDRRCYQRGGRRPFSSSNYSHPEAGV